MYPFGIFGYSEGVNRKLTDEDIEQAFRSLLTEQGRVTGRQLRRALREQWGSCGKSERVYRIWRRLNDEATYAKRGTTALHEQIRALESALATAEDQARRAEDREMAHQDKWAGEIYELRKTVAHLQGKPFHI